MSTISGKRLRIRRGDGTRTLANGELEFDYGNSTLRVGDGSSVGGIGLAGQSGFNLTRTSTGYVFPSESPGIVERSQAQGTTAGYTSGGYTSATVNTIDKFPFSSDSDATDVGDLTQTRQQADGHSSSSHGYTSGGLGPPNSNVIDKFPFSSDSNASDVGDLVVATQRHTGHSSTTDGYTGGGTPTPRAPRIQKFPFSSDTNATEIGTLAEPRNYATGISSTSHG